MKKELIVGGAKRLLILANENLPLLLSAGACLGVVATVILGYQAGKKAPELIEQRKAEKAAVSETPDEEPELTTWEKVSATASVTWKPVAAAGITIGCIVASQYITAERLAVLTAAYAASQKKIKETTESIKRNVTADKADKIFQEADSKSIPTDIGSIRTIEGTGDILAYDEWLGKPFYTTMAKLNGVAGYVNKEFIDTDWVCMADIYQDCLDIRAGDIAMKYGFQREKDGVFGVGSCENMRLNYENTFINGELKPILIVTFNPIRDPEEYQPFR